MKVWSNRLLLRFQWINTIVYHNCENLSLPVVPVQVNSIHYYFQLYLSLLEVEDNKTFGGSGQHDPEGTYRPVKQYVSPRTHLQYDAVGNKRAHPIKIPTGLKGSRPNAEPHARVSVVCWLRRENTCYA